MILHSAISWDVAQRSFNKCTAKQVSFTSDLFWKLVPTASGKIAKIGLPLFWTLVVSNWLDPTDLSAVLGLYSVSISAMYLGPRPLIDL